MDQPKGEKLDLAQCRVAFGLVVVVVGFWCLSFKNQTHVVFH